MTPLHSLDAHALRRPRTAPPSLWAYYWQRLRADARQAGANAKAILKDSAPHIVQTILGLWAVGWGLWMAVCAPATFAANPAIYGWMHQGLFAGVPPRAWGGTSLGLGLWQLHALVWPHPQQRSDACRRAARSLSRFWAGMALGHLANTLFHHAPSPAAGFYLFLAGWSLYVVWRLADCGESPQVEGPQRASERQQEGPVCQSRNSRSC